MIKLSPQKIHYLIPIFLVYFLNYQTLFSQNQLQKQAEKNFRLLNFNSQLSSLVSIDNDGVRIYAGANEKTAGRSEFTLFWDEVPGFQQMMKKMPADTIAKFFLKKENKNFSAEWNITAVKDQSFIPSASILPLAGKKIAIDPGHIAGDMESAKIEQKYIDWPANEALRLPERIQLAEGVLTWQTAMLVKTQLEEAGAEVMITRPAINSTSFGISFDDWCKTRKRTVLDSLKKIKKITDAEYNNLSQSNMKDLFWNFFRDYDLNNRVQVINNFRPDITVIIHYNVDEKNAEWKKPTEKNFSMCFIGGAMTNDNFLKPANKINFLRMLVTEDLSRSEKLSSLLVNEFSNQLGTPIAKKEDAAYLTENCIATSSKGVFSRNLALCRGIYGPLAYGECVYQDNKNECLLLNKNDREFYGITTNERVKQIADCYVNAVNNYFSN